MSKPYPQEFRDDVVRVARNRGPDVDLEQIAKDFGIHFTTLYSWLKKADIEDGKRAGSATVESAQLRAAQRRSRPSSKRTRCRAAPRRISLRLTCRENELPARPRAGR